MRATIIAALAGLAAAAPAITYTEVVNVYTTVWDDGTSTPTEAPAAPAAAPAAPQGGYHGHWHGGWGQPAAPAQPAVQSTAQPVPAAPAYSPAASWAPAPVASSAPAPAPASSWAPAPGAGQPTSPDYSSAVVAHHNAHRANHSASDLAWDAGLAATAEKIASSCVYAHDVSTDGGGYGQNIAAGAPANNISSVITDLFYNNEVGNFASMYGQATPSNINDESAFDGWGHFSQIVWKGTTKVGCATYDCSGRGLANTGSNVPPYFTVCNYSPPGNFLGEFASNVAQPLGHPSITWAST